MIHFFRDVLDGPIYITVAIVSILAIMAIIGFIMERFKRNGEELPVVKNVNTSAVKGSSTLVISSNQLSDNSKLNQENVIPFKIEEKKALENRIQLEQIKVEPQLVKNSSIEENQIELNKSKEDMIHKATEKDNQIEENIPEVHEKTEVLEVVSVPKETSSEKLEKTEVLDLGLNEANIELTHTSGCIQPSIENKSTSLPEQEKNQAPVIDFGSTNGIIVNRE